VSPSQPDLLGTSGGTLPGAIGGRAEEVRLNPSGRSAGSPDKLLGFGHALRFLVRNYVLAAFIESTPRAFEACSHYGTKSIAESRVQKRTDPKGGSSVNVGSRIF
jgi:hypothetical protein